MSTTDPIHRAHQMEILRDNPMLASILDELVLGTIATWRTAQTQQDREAAWHRLQAAETVRTHIERAIDDGRVAQHRQQRRA